MDPLTPPIKNKAIKAIINLMLVYYASMLGMMTSITISLVKSVCLFSVLFVTSYEVVTSNIKLYLMIALVINMLSLFTSLVRFCSYRFSRDDHGIFRFLEYDYFLQVLNIIFVFFLTIVLNESSLSLNESNLLYATLVYLVIFDTCVFMLISIFFVLFVVIATAMKRRKSSFILNLSETNKYKYSCCSICLENYQDNEFLMILYCDHNFHYECVSIWLDINNSCPICKKDLDLSITLYENKNIRL
ncbi:E3 ubiquitin-protein ligase [Nosema granulosis]|uniref:RING-type E3 ubiquitin transferase n=1 Tax=Nosema granulosis TaxID=83296 RepID=A0A9P6H3M3_9MICR|nr:E3 ubiquitin-protein ligase [Nosema granulosis]